MPDTGDIYDRLAQFYDLAMDGFADDIDLYESFARRVDAPVLELGAGTGRVALELAQRGLTVMGVDRSAAMLEIARGRARDERLTTVEFRQDDMRCPKVEGRFGLVVCAIDTFLHLGSTEEQLATLSAARERLAPGGLIVIDQPGPAGDWGDWAPDAHALVHDWTRPLGDSTVTRLSSYRADLAEQTRYFTDIYDVISREGTLRRHVIQYPLRFVFPAEMALLLRQASLSLQARYGDYELSPFNAASERMIVVAGGA